MILLAYIDPGLGALVWQTVVAAFVGFLFYLKQTRRWLVNVYCKIFRRAQRSAGAPPAASAAEKAGVKTDAS